MRTFNVVIPANSSEPISEKGRVFVIRSATAAVDIQTRDGAVRMQGVSAGQGFRNYEFAGIVISNPNASAVTLAVAVGVADLIDSVQLTGTVNMAGTSALTIGKITVTTGGVSISPVANQKKITLRADKANTVSVTNGATAGTGIFYDAGESETIETAAAINLIVPSGTAVMHYRQES